MVVVLELRQACSLGSGLAACGLAHHPVAQCLARGLRVHVQMLAYFAVLLFLSFTQVLVLALQLYISSMVMYFPISTSLASTLGISTVELPTAPPGPSFMSHGPCDSLAVSTLKCHGLKLCNSPALARGRFRTVERTTYPAIRASALAQSK